MLFTFNTTESAVRELYELAKENKLSSTQFFKQHFCGDWFQFDKDEMPSWKEVSDDLLGGDLACCFMTAKSINDREISVRWDIECYGGSVLRWEAGPPVCEAEDSLFNRLCWSSNMMAYES